MPTSIPSVNNYLKQRALALKAQDRMKNSSGAAGEAKAVQAPNQTKQTEIGNRIASITNKLMAGKKLSSAELSFLRKHSPELFEKAVRVTREREGYRRRLNKARTKDEADRIHMEKQQQLYSEANQKGADSDTLAMRSSAILDERLTYIKQKRPSKS